ncbi:MAG: hypothetical protein IH607_08710, partial [Firmicutes bacterium]|nr:hypothetical protein [Bacillota bacterium]
MPVTARKNTLYAAALPLLGRRCHWRHVQANGGDADIRLAIERTLLKHRVVGGCVQVIRGGQAAELYCAGYASLCPRRPADPDTVFRTAS